mmetsp:Transcript_46339/g.63071  ORF Transcript_46339/g.63071 Transcript_46339/m.63071 type:complete len:400 (-) Transcript_46339:297-1496(-)|eukprot:CAMPEP_0185754334 /NCGR_PEP_ID=MMETSP1174-20130828/12973_1 /TAXON_ID=35687 /ORGANISM="Dictyocha speculum, Strain CCMP1381" /LENGTH=399 /DNA_ID=CAMNT_0028432491 /DNA_START=120 /DNA_END=1319 /DNA_ORIENTATION=+
MPKKKVFVKPRPKQPKITQEEKDKRLVYHATKVLSQAARKVKSFEVQRAIRCIQRRKKTTAEDAGDSENRPDWVQRVKTLDVAVSVVPHALALLGLGPGPGAAATTGVEEGTPENIAAPKDGTPSRDDEEESTDSEDDGIETTPEMKEEGEEPLSSAQQQQQQPQATTTTTTTLDPAMEAVVQRMLQHSVMLKAIKLLEPKARQRRLEKLAISEGRPLPRKRDMQANSAVPAEKTVSVAVNHRRPTTIFLDSLSGEVDDEDDDDTDESDSEIPTTKKNRPGQRARQASRQRKEERLRAKKRGRGEVVPFEKNDDMRAGKRPKKKVTAPSAVREGGEVRKGPRDGSAHRKHEGKQSGRNAAGGGNLAAQKKIALHPSWAAKQNQKEVQIVQFKGKKTTFG